MTQWLMAGPSACMSKACSSRQTTNEQSCRGTVGSPTLLSTSSLRDRVTGNLRVEQDCVSEATMATFALVVFSGKSCQKNKYQFVLAGVQPKSRRAAHIESLVLLGFKQSPVMANLGLRLPSRQQEPFELSMKDMLWMVAKSISHDFETMVETIVGICRGIIIPGFLGWCKIDFVHPEYDLSQNQNLVLTWSTQNHVES